MIENSGEVPKGVSQIQIPILTQRGLRGEGVSDWGRLEQLVFFS